MVFGPLDRDIYIYSPTSHFTGEADRTHFFQHVAIGSDTIPRVTHLLSLRRDVTRAQSCSCWPSGSKRRLRIVRGLCWPFVVTRKLRIPVASPRQQWQPADRDDVILCEVNYEGCPTDGRISYCYLFEVEGCVKTTFVRSPGFVTRRTLLCRRLLDSWCSFTLPHSSNGRKSRRKSFWILPIQFKVSGWANLSSCTVGLWYLQTCLHIRLLSLLKRSGASIFRVKDPNTLLSLETSGTI